jgi:hypothetical protein
MDSFLPTFEGPLRLAYPLGTYGDPGLSSTCSSRELLLREHALTCLYWFPGQDPLHESLLQRVEDVLPGRIARKNYLKNYSHWGQRLSQARLEGMAIVKKDRDYIMPNEKVIPPLFYYPSVALDFVTENYLPGAAVALRKYREQESLKQAQQFYDRAAVRAREAVCLLGIYLEFTQYADMSDSTCLLDRMIHTIIALNPVLRLGLPGRFGDFVRRSIVSIAQYFYEQKESVLSCMSDVPPEFYDDLAECLAELANLMMQIGPYRRLDDGEFLGAA